MAGKSVKNFLLFGGTDKENYDSVRDMLWERNVNSIKITALLSGGIGAVFLIMNLIIGSSVLVPYAFLLCGSALTTVILRFVRAKGNTNELLRMTVCYAHIILVGVYAGILSTQPSNYATPATSVIVFIALLPLTIDDRPLRMFSVMLGETAAYLTVSYFLKSPQAFSLDVLNAATFCVVGMVLYGVICVRNVREIYQSQRVEKIQRSIISSLAAVVEERDESTGNHILRTEDYVERLLRKMRAGGFEGLTKDYCNNVVLAAPMHDIGKIKISDTILNKPGRLTPEEYEIIKMHSVFGGDIIRRTISEIEEKEYCEIAYNIARHHHERYDGTGYPDGLKGEAIPLEARIMALADVYDALVSERVYKKAFPKEEAVRIIREGAGTQFDPRLVPLFLECVETE
ncbi:MAG: HD domain-containing protein [Clostridia bacterium]|nr:HD domain-containing protein [Clostridia bacterium]